MKRDFKIIITNGVARSGKDSFFKAVENVLASRSKDVALFKSTSIHPINFMLLDYGWDGKKTDEYRYLVSSIKKIIPNATLKRLEQQIKRINNWGTNPYILFYDVRESDEIKKVKDRFGEDVITVLIRRKVAEDNCPNNDSDQDVFNYLDYDKDIFNNGDLQDLGETALNFCKEFKLI